MKLMSFNEFVRKHELKNEPKSKINIQEVLGSVGLDNAGIYLRDEPF